MRDITLSELEVLSPRTGELDGTLQMDQDSFTSFYERTSRPVWAYLWRRTGDRNLADDLLQEAYYRFLRARVVHQSESHRRNYLFRIATNLVHDSHRSHPVHLELPNEGETGHPTVESSAGRSGHQRQDLDRALTHLSSRQRDALWLAYAEGSSHQEIANSLGLKVGSVKLLLFRARRKLVKLLGGTGGIMSRLECKHESDIHDAVASGRWPDRADSDLRAHAAVCSICADVALISVLYRDDHALAMEETRIPSAGLVWWKSELRARREAVRVASRPITMVQWIAGACIVAVLLGVLVGLSNQIDTATVSNFVLGQPLILWVVLGIIVTLTPIALYFVCSDE